MVMWSGFAPVDEILPQRSQYLESNIVRDSGAGAVINSIERPRHWHWYASARVKQKMLHLALRGIRRLG
jgi:hypothetical protein